jgi:hypothetical protein
MYTTPPSTRHGAALGFPEAEFVFRYPSGPDVTVPAAYTAFCTTGPDVPVGFTAGNGTIPGSFNFGPGGSQLYGFLGRRE